MRPGKAGLAFANLLPGRKVVYIGLDRAQPMLRKAMALLEAGRSASMFANDATIKTVGSWQRLQQALTKLPTSNVLVNATYLFASSSLDVSDVIDLVGSLKANDRVRNLLLTYSNSTEPVAGRKYTEFKRRMKGEFSSEGLAKVTITYKKRRLGNATSDATYVRELLRFKVE